MTQVISGDAVRKVRGGSGKACLLAAVALVLGLSGNGPAQATTGGSPYEVPQVLDADGAANVVETYIVAEEAVVDIGGGVTANAMAFKSCSDAGLATCTTAAIPGPEFRLNVGDRVIVHYVNNLLASGLTPEANVSGIHWHGIELNNASDGTEVTQAAVAPAGGTFDYDFIVTRPGIFWYHPHHHSSTNQVAKGLYGSIIVKDPNEAALIANNVIPANDAAHTKTLVISDITVCNPGNNPATHADDLPHVSGLSSSGFNKWQYNYENHPMTQSPTILCDSAPLDANGDPAGGAFGLGDVPNIQEPGPIGRMSEGFTVLTNGVQVDARGGTPKAPENPPSASVLANALPVEAGQGLRLQIVNPSPVRYLRLRLTTAGGRKLPLVRIGGEGGLLNFAVVEGGVTATGFKTKYNRGEILLPPASRADVVAKIPGLLPVDSVLTLWTQDFQRVAATYSWTPTVPVMHLKVTGTAAAPYGIFNGKKLLASLGANAKVKLLGAPTAGLITPTGEGGDAGTTDKDVKFTFEPLTGGFQPSINGIPMPRDFTGWGAEGLGTINVGNPFYLASARHATLSNTIELTVTNMTGANHPFHLHGFSFQPKKLTPKAGTTGPTYVFPREFRDIVDVPPFHSLTFRVSLDERPDFGAVDGGGGGNGRWLFHCHILPHATFGMMSELHIH